MHKIPRFTLLGYSLTAALSGFCLTACQTTSSTTTSTPQTVLKPAAEVGPSTKRAARQAEVARILAPIDFRRDGAVPRDHIAPQTRPSALPVGPEDVSPLGRARHAWNFGHRQEALRFVVESCWQHPEDAEGWTFIGHLLRLEGKYEEAHSALRRAASAALGASTESQLAAAVELARLQEYEGRTEDAIRAWQDALHIDPNNAVAYRRLAALHWLQGNVEVAAHLVEELGSQGHTGPLPPQLQALAGPFAPRANVIPRPAGFFGGVTSPARIDTGGGSQAAEVHITAAANGELLAGWNDLREPNGVDAWSLGVGISSNGGVNWSDALLRAPGNNGDDFEGDPMGVYDPRTGNTWIGGITFFPNRNIYVARRPPGSNSLLQPIIIESDLPFDKGLLAAGPAPGLPDTTRLYVTYNLGLQSSADLGTSWSTLIPLGNGVSHHPRVGPDGTLYIAYWDFDDQILLQRSVDGGATVQAPLPIATRFDVWDAQDGTRFPGRFRVAPIAYLAIDPNDGTLYCVYFDTTSVDAGQRNVDIYFTRSDDQGFNWTVPRIINGDSDPPADQFFPWLEVDTSGALHLAFFDSRDIAQSDDQVAGFFNVYYSISRDRGDTWNEARITPNSFESVDATWPGFEQFMGDFISVTPDPDPTTRTAWVAYPATFDGDLDIYVQRVDGGPEIFQNGFESGDVSAWSDSLP